MNTEKLDKEFYRERIIEMVEKWKTWIFCSKSIITYFQNTKKKKLDIIRLLYD